MKKNIQHLVMLIVSMITIFTFNAPVQAQNTPVCDPCTNAWGGEVATKFSFALKSHPGCKYGAYIVYRTRTCFDKLQLDVVSAVFTSQTIGHFPGFGSCDITSSDVDELNKLVNVYLLNLVSEPGKTVIRSNPSACYYTARVVLTAAAAACFELPQNTTCNVLLPCDPNGCCYSQLTLQKDGESYQQDVIKSTPCFAIPAVPATLKVVWSCPETPRFFTSFTLVVRAQQPVTCVDLCENGLSKAGPATGMNEMNGTKEISAISVYPNPFKDHVDISFEAAKDKQDISIELFDLSGKQVLSRKEKSVAGRNTITIDTHELAAGVYTCSLTCGTEKVVVKINK